MRKYRFIVKDKLPYEGEFENYEKAEQFGEKAKALEMIVLLKNHNKYDR